jgi:hypothetical protein
MLASPSVSAGIGGLVPTEKAPAEKDPAEKGKARKKVRRRKFHHKTQRYYDS